MTIERTLAIIKPDAIAKGVAGQIITRIENAGFKILASKLIQMSHADAAASTSSTGSGRSSRVSARS